MSTRVMRKRTGLWLGAKGGGVRNFDVHPEDDMIMIEAQDGKDDWEIFICPELFPAIRACMDTLEGRNHHETDRSAERPEPAAPDAAATG